jgi:hypothetical protein
LDEALNFDALATAEKVTGKSYKDDQNTADVGMGLFMAHNKAKEDLLIANDDTHFNIAYSEAERIIVSLGFRDALVVPFKDAEGRDEALRIMYRRGVLLILESYRDHANSIKIHFNLKPHNQNDHFPDRMSGGCVGVKDGKAIESFGDKEWANRDYKIYYGNVDARSGLRHIMQKLEQQGEFVTPWVKIPHLWMVTYAEAHHKSEDWQEASKNYDQINKERLLQLPAEIWKELGL